MSVESSRVTTSEGDGTVSPGWLIPGSLVVGGGALILGFWVGCANPRACEDESDCFEGQVCRGSRCVDTDAGASGTGGDGTTLDAGETSSGETIDTGSGSSGDSGESSGGDSGGSGATNGDSGDGPCEKNACRWESECEELTDKISLRLGCVGSSEESGRRDVRSVEGKDGCHCGVEESEDPEGPFADKISVARYLDSGGECDGYYEGKGVDVTVEIGACGLENFDDVTLEHGPDECPQEVRNPSEETWCQKIERNGTIELHWRPTNEADQSTAFEILYDAERRFDYEVSATIFDPNDNE